MPQKGQTAEIPGFEYGIESPTTIDKAGRLLVRILPGLGIVLVQSLPGSVTVAQGLERHDLEVGKERRAGIREQVFRRWFTSSTSSE